MQYLALYIVILLFILLSFVRGKHILFNIIITAYPTAVIYKAIIEYGDRGIIDAFSFIGDSYTVHVFLFVLILIPVYMSMYRIVNQFRLHHNFKGVIESILLSVGIVLLTIGISFHILPNSDIFNLATKTEIFFQSDFGYLLCMIAPMISVFLLSKHRDGAFTGTHHI